MKRTFAASVLVWLSATACQSPPVADLAVNDLIYRDTGFLTKLPGDRSVFLAPLQDERVQPVDAVVNAYPVQYDGDGRWVRPVVEMVDDVLRRELSASALFKELTAEPATADVVLMPTLVSFATAAVEHESGGRSLAEIGIRVQAFGPLPGVGERPLLLDQVYGDRQLTEIAFRTTSRHLLAGLATRTAVLRLLQGLDSKSTGRNGMPVQVAPAAVPTK